MGSSFAKISCTNYVSNLSSIFNASLNLEYLNLLEFWHIERYSYWINKLKAVYAYRVILVNPFELNSPRDLISGGMLVLKSDVSSSKFGRQ